MLNKKELTAILEAEWKTGMFKEIDADKSGHLTRKELEAAIAKRKNEMKNDKPEKREAMIKFFEELYANFDELDKNKDHLLNYFEFTNAFNKARDTILAKAAP